ncbi:MAG: SH3 domain-containing protein [Bdellovibrionaceae bacterium]|nr:SH3 domain-containing protein [Bdellovibrio sp.]
MKKLTFIIIFALTIVSKYASAQAVEGLFAKITTKNVLLFESPTTSSPVIRRVFEGEVLKITETVQAEHGEVWGKVYLSPSHVGYIQGAYFQASGTLQQEIWRPQEVLRSQMPISFALKGPSEFFGAGLQFRYLPFARLGINVGVGSVLDNGRMKGNVLSYGVVCMLSTNNLSPFVETGSSTLTFNDNHSTLRISTFYVNAGLEWIFSSGYFFGLGFSYNRSFEVQLAYDYEYARASNGTLPVGDYGTFNGVTGPSSLQKLNPLFVVGYSF